MNFYELLSEVDAILEDSVKHTITLCFLLLIICIFILSYHSFMIWTHSNRGLLKYEQSWMNVFICKQLEASLGPLINGFILQRKELWLNLTLSETTWKVSIRFGWHLRSPVLTINVFEYVMGTMTDVQYLALLCVTCEVF